MPRSNSKRKTPPEGETNAATSTLASVFPIFDGCSEWTIDPYWKEIFDQCAQGRLPKGLRINRNNLVTVPNGSSFQLKGGPQDVFKTMMQIFRTDLDLGSENDASKRREQIEIVRRELIKSYSGTWKQIKLKNAKLAMIMEFVIKVSKEHKLTKTQSKRLMADIRLGLLFGTISSDDIEYEEGCVLGIRGLSLSRGSYAFDSPICGSEGESSTKRPAKTQKSEARAGSSNRTSKRLDPNSLPSSLSEYLSNYTSSVVNFSES